MYFKCPVCGKQKNIKNRVDDLYQKGFSCPFCGDKGSKANKFIREVSKQLLELKEIDYFQVEYQPEWIKKYRYRYDCYLQKGDVKILIEMDGLQHKEDRGEFSQGVKERDKIKNELAKENGFILIRVDCFETNFEFVKNSFLKTDIERYVSLEKINWKSVNIEMEKNLTKEICDKYNQNENLTTREMGKIFNVSFITIIRALKKGDELGWCVYNAKEYGQKTKKTKTSISIDVYDENDNFVATFFSLTKTRNWLNEQCGERKSLDKISKCLKGTISSYEGYKFKYHNDSLNPI